MRDPKKKCIAKKCDECQFYQGWDVVEHVDGKLTGLSKIITRCSLQVLFDEIPNIRGSIDGCQQASNETKNKVESFGDAAVSTLKTIATNVPKLLR